MNSHKEPMLASQHWSIVLAMGTLASSRDGLRIAQGASPEPTLNPSCPGRDGMVINHDPR